MMWPHFNTCLQELLQFHLKKRINVNSNNWAYKQGSIANTKGSRYRQVSQHPLNHTFNTCDCVK